MSVARAILADLASDPEALDELRRLVGAASADAELLSPSEVAAMCKVTTRTVNRWASEGLVDAVKVGKGWRFTRDAVEALKVCPSPRRIERPKPARRSSRRRPARGSSVADAIRGG